MASISCLLWLIGVAQGAADCSGSSCLPRSSLLQVKSKARRQSASLETHSSLNAQLAEYTKFTEDLVAKYDQEPPSASGDQSLPVTDDERNAVRVVLEFLDDMYKSLKTWHDADERQAAQCTSESIVNECQLSQNDTDKINLRSSAVEALAKEHQDCRSQGPITCPLFPTQCPDYDKYRKNQGEYSVQTNDAKVPSSPLSSMPSCVQVSPDSAAFADASIQTSDMDQLQTMEDCLRQTKSWLDPLYRKYSDCERQEDACTAFCPQCEAKQKLFEEKHCEWYAYLSTGCSGVQTCGEDMTAECDTACTNIEVRESARIADNETGQRLVCLLHVIFGTPHDVNDENTEWDDRPSDADRPKALADCKQAAYSTPSWDIKCDPGTWTSPAPCDHFNIPTCSEKFQSVWFTDRGLNLPCTGECSCQDQAYEKRVDQCQLSGGTCNVL